MGSLENHFKLYEQFKEDAKNTDNFEGTRVEAYFLSAFHLIESCAAKERVHINKHQNVRSMLMKNEFIFGDKTENVWKHFQKIENQLRPKFTYGFSWTKEDMNDVQTCYGTIEDICLRKIKGRPL